ncbi:MazG family protein [Microbispora sp. NBRC 16548]|uniref:MazG family protein n=1 Tax=Microbispora sp. NBRC 16548 TaxID=3030994 RepID=UPI0024A0DEBA|nr:MazG family protein [Microbispora sp. NBRC 16548]GLX08683.1 nucleoside triphosphate pyrophosphohydrolase [Microbispora sp. NBRC 16548]
MALIVVTTSPRVAPGLLAPAAWKALTRGRVLTGTPDHPYLPYLDEAGVRVEVVTPDPGAVARESRTGTVVWLAAQDGDEDFMRAVGHAAISLDEPPEIEVVPGSYDLPGARLLDLVQVMDRLRRECPWDRKQTHESLVPYLVEEAYEVLETIHEGAYGPPLREELGDLLLQVVFHARLAQERMGPEEAAGDGFDIDDVAAGIVEKLVRRHPHVFADVEVSGAGDVADNWEAIKAAERAAKGETGSALSGVPMGQPAISLAAQLLRRAGRAGAPASLAGDLAPPAGARLFALVRETQDAGLDPEAELRAAAREYRRRVEQWEDAADTP